MITYHDLSQPVKQGMTYFPGDPVPDIQPAAEAVFPWRVSDLHIGTHTGTHIDAAAHYLPEGQTIDQYPISRFLLQGVVIAVPGLTDDQAISEEHIRNQINDIPKGGAILIRTDWDQYWSTDRYLRHPYLTAEASQQLIEAGASLIGIDALNVDSTVQSTDHAHRLLLGNDILIVENLTRLSELQTNRVYQFSFLPILFAGLDGSPIRAVAW